MASIYSQESELTRHNSISSSPSARPFFVNGFFDKDISRQRGVFLKVAVSGSFLVVLAIFAVFSIFWGSLWDTSSHIHNIEGWVVDFDDALIGHTVTQSFAAISGGPGAITWSMRSAAEFPGGPAEVSAAISDEKAWAAIIINHNATNNLMQATANPDASYNGALAITAYGVEARNENLYRVILKANIERLAGISATFARKYAIQLSNSSNIATILATAPQVITQPISYSLVNLRPFDVTVATAATFVGLIYLTILSFFTVIILNGAREASGLEKLLNYRSLALLRLLAPIAVYFFLTLFYSLLSLAFNFPFSRFFGRGGFMVYWMLSWFGMSALGLAIEAMFTLLTARFAPFFLIIWIITNISVISVPLELLPQLFHYGYGSPFFNISQGTRAIAFGTKNTLGVNFGVLAAWIVISSITLPLFVFMRHTAAKREAHKQAENEVATVGDDIEKSGL